MSNKRVFIIVAIFFIVSLLVIVLASYKTSAQWDQDYWVKDKKYEFNREEERDRTEEQPIEVSEDYKSKEDTRV